MIFNDLNEFSEDLKNKILNFVSNKCYDHSRILSIIRSYLHEVQNINEIKSYNIEFNHDTFIVTIENYFEEMSFNVHIANEIRKQKIKRLNKEHYMVL